MWGRNSNLAETLCLLYNLNFTPVWVHGVVCFLLTLQTVTQGEDIKFLPSVVNKKARLQRGSGRHGRDRGPYTLFCIHMIVERNIVWLLQAPFILPWPSLGIPGGFQVRRQVNVFPGCRRDNVPAMCWKYQSSPPYYAGESSLSLFRSVPREDPGT